MAKERILVVGATGTVGSHLMKTLTAQGHAVRGLTSKKGGHDLVHADLVTGEGLQKAFDGVDRAFLLSPPGHADQYKILSPLIQEAKRRGLKKVVLMTAFGANAVETSPFRRAEIELEKSGLTYNIIRPNWFLQNFNTFWGEGIRKEGLLALPAGTAKVSFIDARDVGEVAARLLTSSEHDNQALDLTGPEAVDHARVAEVIGRHIGKTVRYQEIPPEDLKRGLLAAGLPADYVEFMLLIFGFLREGYNAGVTDNVSRLLGRPARSLAEYVRTF